MRTTQRELQRVHSDLYRRMTSFEFKVKLSEERVDRIGRVIALEQLAAAAMAPVGRRSRQSRIRFWADAARAAGWPDGLTSG